LSSDDFMQHFAKADDCHAASFASSRRQSLLFV
jgi:hypothetical protein